MRAALPERADGHPSAGEEEAGCDLEGFVVATNDSLLNAARTFTGEPAELDHEVHRVARRLTDEPRAHSATAGWRVLARDNRVV